MPYNFSVSDFNIAHIFLLKEQLNVRWSNHLSRHDLNLGYAHMQYSVPMKLHPELAVRIYMATGISHVMYALTQANIITAAWRRLELAHHASLRLCLGLPQQSKVASTLAEAGAWPLRLQALHYGMNFIARRSSPPTAQPCSRGSNSGHIHRQPNF